MPNEAQKTIKEFVEIILRFSDVRAKRWIEEHKMAVNGISPNFWDGYCALPITEDSIKSIGIGISARVSREIRGSPDAENVLQEGLWLLELIVETADVLGIKVNMEDINAIIKPQPLHPPQI